MTVQISVTIWTILCFLVLMLVLDRLLFRPLLGFMDRRQARIDDARAARETAVREREAALRQREEDHLSAEKRAMQDASARLEELRRENARRAEEKKADNARLLALQREELAVESRSIREQLEPRMGELAAAFALRLQTWQDREEADLAGDTAPRTGEAEAVPVNTNE